MQGEADARAVPSDIEKWRVRNASGGLVPFSNFVDASWTYGPQGVNRYNGVPAMQIQGSPAPGVSTGDAIAEIERLAQQLPPGFQISLTGLSLEEQESGSQAPLLYGLSLAAIFLALAALYESWSIPFAVMLAMPVGVVGALGGAWLGGFENGVFFQVGARDKREAGESIYEAAVDAARQRFRPILMTSMAFSLGVLPLVLSTGAGSGGRTAIGSGVLSGTITGTVLGVLFVPLFFAMIARLGRKKKAA